MSAHRTAWGASVVLVGLMNVRCGDDSATPDDGGRDDARTEAEDGDVRSEDVSTGDAEADGPGDDGGRTWDLAVHVARTTGVSDEELPAVGATVTLDRPDGTREEGTADGTGLVTFEDIAWMRGTIDVTAYLAGHRVVSVADVPEPTTPPAEVNVVLGPIGLPTDYVEVSGTAANMTAETHYLAVSATAPHIGHQAVGPDWSIRVTPGAPFTLVARELEFLDSTSPTGRGIDNPIYAWTAVEHAAVAVPATAELDFSEALTPSTVSGSFRLPTRTDSPLRSSTFAFVYVTGFPGWPAVGWTTSSDVNSIGDSMEYELQQVTVPAMTQTLTVYRLLPIRGTYSSNVVLEGAPTAGAHDLRFLDLPEMVAPPDTRTHHPFHDPLQWRLFDTGVQVRVVVTFNDEPVWVVRMPDDATTVTIPEPPSTVDVAALMGTGLVEAWVNLSVPSADGEYTQKWSEGPTFLLELP